MLNNLLLGQTAEEKLFVEDVFSTYLYTGNGSTQTITNGIDLAGKGGLVWVKSRTNGSAFHRLQTQEGSGYRSLYSNSTSSGTALTSSSFAFTSSGFTNFLGGDFNASGENFASWTFRKAPKFFDVVTYTGNGASNRQISHSLGVEPGMIIVKCVSSGAPNGDAANWTVYHRSVAASSPESYFLLLNSTAAYNAGSTRWNNTAPTATNFTVGSSSQVNWSGETYVAYLFAHDTTADGVIQCGSFTTDGSGNATVNLGWEPQFLLYKSTSSIGSWAILDNMRGWSVGGDDERINPNTSGNATTFDMGYPTATGFNFIFPANTSVAYVAIRRGPMRVPTDATKVYKAITRAGTGAAASISTVGFPPDLILNSGRTGNCEFAWADKIRGRTILRSAQTNAETDLSSFPSNDLVSYDQNGFSVGPDYNTQINQAVGGRTEVYECFRRAPGFFDVVCYTGTGSARTVSHNLGVAPELMIVKSRSDALNWFVYTSATGNTKALYLEDTASAATSSVFWNNTSPTSSVFTVGSGGGINGSGSTFVAYLFASCPGVSKVGSYTGTGTTQQINCGFTNGARFVLIKRTDSTGDWTVWDTARGIVSGNDPYLLLNSTAAEVTNTDYIDPLSTGFEISSTAPAAINANGGTFVFLAIA